MSSLTSIPFQKLLAASTAAASSSSSSISPLKSLLFKPPSYRSFFHPRPLAAATPFRLRFAAAATTSTMGGVAADSAMDAVQRRLMFEDEFVPYPSFFQFALAHIACFEILGLLI